MKNTINILLSLILCIVSVAARANEVPELKIDGNWLLTNINAAQRFDSSKNPAIKDAVATSSLTFFIKGFMAAQSYNKTVVPFYLAINKAGKDKEQNQRMERFAKMFVQIDTPQEITIFQAFLIIKKYLLKNPQELNNSAELVIINAFK